MALSLGAQPFFVKFFSEEKYAKDFANDGTIKISRVKLFSKSDSAKARLDEKEGKMSFESPAIREGKECKYWVSQKDGIPVYLSMDENQPHPDRFQVIAPFGGEDFVYSLALFNNKEPLSIDQLSQCVKNLGRYVVVIPDANFLVDLIDKCPTLHGYLTRSKEVIYHQGQYELSAFNKDDEFAYQSEYRFLWDKSLSKEDWILVTLGKFPNFFYKIID